jgi:alpha-N-arabinofuranosidase
VSIHGYWDHTHHVNNLSDYLTCMMRSESPEAMIQRTRHVIGAAGLLGKIKIAFDEWNLRGWHHPDGVSQDVVDARGKNDIASGYTMADAVFSAGFLNACLRNADIVEMANIAPAINTRGPLFVHPEGIVKRTTFYVLRMYAQRLRANIVAASVKSSSLTDSDKSVSAVDALVSRDDNGIAVALINRNPSEAARCTVSIDGTPLVGSFNLETLSGDTVNAFNSIERPEAVSPTTEQRELSGHIEVPPHSICLVYGQLQ